MKYCLIEIYKTFSDDYAKLEKMSKKHYAIDSIRLSNRYLSEQYIEDFERGITNQLLLISDDDMGE